jgi:glycosyltransferase involved in cell wall biosynthesis
MSKNKPMQPGGRMGDSAAADVPATSRPLLFYSYWSLEYYNPEAKLKAEALDRAGYDVVYVAGIGMRNPGLSSFGKLIDRTLRKLVRRSPETGESMSARMRTAAVAAVPPRQLRLIRRTNEAWMARQLRKIAFPWEEAVVWIRWPTPELVGALVRHPPAAIVYECVDPYDVGPGVRGRWSDIYRSAEAALVEAADLVVVPAAALGERFAGRADVRIIPHGVDLRLFPNWGYAARTDRRTVGFAGTLDYRLDTEVLRRIADDGRWGMTLVGPVGPGFPVDAFARHPNVSVRPAVPHERIGEVLAGFDVGILPYHRRAPGFDYEYTDPLKALELLAAGKPVVAKPNKALERLAPVVSFADTPAGFVEAIDAVMAEDSVQLAAARRALAESNDWATRLNELSTSVQALRGPVMGALGAGDRSPR